MSSPSPAAELSIDGPASGFLRKALSEDRSAVIVAADLTPVLRGILHQLGAFPASFNHLGQACLGAVLMQALSDTDEDEKVELQWQLTGPFGNLFADSLGTGKIRGTLQNLKADVDSFKVGLGKGVLQVRKLDKENVKNTGIIESSGWVSEDLKTFLEQSEQKTCRLHLHVAFEIEKDASGVEVLQLSDAFGFLIHILPTDSDEQKEKMIELWNHRTQMLGPLKEWSLPRNPEDSTRAITEWLTVGSKPMLLKKYPVDYFCTCSVDRVQRALGLLTSREKKWVLSDSADTSESVSINCEFCGKSYNIRKEDLA